MEKKNIVFLTGSGISQESGIDTFRDAGGLWEQHKVEEVATHSGYIANPVMVNNFYNSLRVKYKDTKPNEAHNIIAELEDNYNVYIITQNVDNLHEASGSHNVLHLHGNMMVACSSDDVENINYHVQLPHNGWGTTGLEIPENEKAPDGSLYRPYIVLFNEPVPNMEKAISYISMADIFVVCGTSLNVYPAAGALAFVDPTVPIYVIDPADVNISEDINEQITHIKEVATVGMRKLKEILINND